MTESTGFTAAWNRHHPYLVNLAYQMLGDVGDAEDVAQEAFLRLSRTEPGEIDDVRAWLTTVAGRLCLDLVRSARARRESPTDLEQGTIPTLPARDPDPADRITLDDEVSGALLRVLRQLSAGERVAFILHDVFQVPFDAIAETVGRPVGTCRQLARRARTKIASTADDQARDDDVTTAEHQLVTEKFITACAGGDVQALAAVLDPTVWGVGTVLSDPPIPPIVNHGPQRVAENLMLYLGPGTTVVAGPLGQPVLLAFAHQQLFAVVVLTIRDGLVAKIEATADPLARFGA
ncbi:RNA polymerase sigma factor SigI [Mycobacterium sp. CBMA293]|uniref:RNA polymerase sigma factor SigI n=1 Tax=unclassified Mycolicibacterium TaxID=2636767 RepID=UPI0012DFCFBF|nr:MULTISPECIES: RNA polymerase sigma factor SigI [unclassified Mycolicibacterium]MUL45411.1 RNA polymerase sigma factor SigI [Mycolicibacterium sp. CBMA 360]MUL56932.1 RNA polymerase sigma factor SigI [Mycolicibacterium sp. CBMA 335]MUL69972.1 RNA polymerase sigma factor SigI [Mycolicibacterium sp. CBMA 311]MUL92020.1 RNA polymerase sigma factor SigI [Mycolicibacterium sp. CBMA 230]MUM05758.1 RNA polymerase subunit sigma [Mycolicibacterium sp. CBMA 213]